MKRQPVADNSSSSGPKVAFSLYSMSSSSANSNLKHTERLNQLKKKFSSDTSMPDEDLSQAALKTCNSRTAANRVDEESQDQEECIRGNLTPLELSQLDEIKTKLSKLKMPETPGTPYELYNLDNPAASDAKRKWERLTADEKARYEQASSQKFAEYQKEYDAILQESSKLWALHDSIRTRGDMEKRVASKRISPYRVYKRETAAAIKAEFPLMSNEERSQIVKQRWKLISTKAKEMYVILARIEEETHNYEQRQAFYAERIATSREQSGLKPLASGKLYPMREDPWSLVEMVFCKKAEEERVNIGRSTTSSDRDENANELPVMDTFVK